jgi:hypothetical protein
MHLKNHVWVLVALGHAEYKAFMIDLGEKVNQDNLGEHLDLIYGLEYVKATRVTDVFLVTQPKMFIQTLGVWPEKLGMTKGESLLRRDSFWAIHVPTDDMVKGFEAAWAEITPENGESMLKEVAVQDALKNFRLRRLK